MAIGRFLLSGVLLATAACDSSSPGARACTILCSQEGACPEAMACGIDGFCHDVSDEGDCRPPAMGEPDATPAELLPDASSLRDPPDAGTSPPDATPDEVPAPDAAPEPPPPCAGGDLNYLDPDTNHCYMLFVASREWDAARGFCAGIDANTHLVTIGSWEEAETAYSMAYGREVWMGFNDRVYESYWGWVTNEPVVFWIWQSGEPNDRNGEDCGEIAGDDGGYWNDEECGSDQAFLCERDWEP